VGLQLTRPKLSEALERKPSKTGARQNSTRWLVQMGIKPHPSNQWILKGPYLRTANSSK
jgi:hypothetical protein